MYDSKETVDEMIEQKRRRKKEGWLTRDRNLKRKRREGDSCGLHPKVGS